MEDSPQHNAHPYQQSTERQVRARKVTPGAGRGKSPSTEPSASMDREGNAQQTRPPGTVRPIASQGPAVAASTVSAAPAQSADRPTTKRRLRFEERYDRVTLYLEKPVNERLRELHASGEVHSLTHVHNAALKNYLDKNFGK
ncbi:hypothetical protein [Alicyclobacillus sp. ALC3]|uniref:hypothetical protein n=1 Tax=Alicyclobacillus sp. ALC3 TaxID=2796143 RepID=UPI00237909EB|nr:hypothetical protein [Alicyclobacillus sp. ALC3]WDL99189.1 hypothetical protein JC200_11410 [Alicyclobacillus sp. ALC3]